MRACNTIVLDAIIFVNQVRDVYSSVSGRAVHRVPSSQSLRLVLNTNEAVGVGVTARQRQDNQFENLQFIGSLLFSQLSGWNCFKCNSDKCLLWKLLFWLLGARNALH